MVETSRWSGDGGFTQTLIDVVKRTDINYLLCVFSFGDMAPEHAMRSLEMFAKDVMPKVRAATKR